MTDLAARITIGNDLPIQALISAEDVDFTDDNHVTRLRMQTVALMEDALRSPELAAFYDGASDELDIDPTDVPVIAPDVDE